MVYQNLLDILKDPLNNFYRQDVYMNNAYETIQKMNINLMDMFKKL